MPNTWTHSRLGTFEHDDTCWLSKIEIAFLEAFTYIDAAVRFGRKTRNPFELIMQCDSEVDEPNEQMIALAVEFLNNESLIIASIVKAIWSELMGEGPYSGMWWHGDLAFAFRGGDYASAVQENLRDSQLPIPTCPEDLKRILEPKNLTIRRDFAAPKPWIAELNFYSGFDVEHGVGVLTDGHEVLGIGYSSDANRFKK